MSTLATIEAILAGIGAGRLVQEIAQCFGWWTGIYYSRNGERRGWWTWRVLPAEKEWRKLGGGA